MKALMNGFQNYVFHVMTRFNQDMMRVYMAVLGCYGSSCPQGESESVHEYVKRCLTMDYEAGKEGKAMFPDLYQVTQDYLVGTKRHMTCVMCFNYMGPWVQHPAMEKDRSICPSCVSLECGSKTSDQIRSLYGHPHLNYDQPLQYHDRRWYRVLGSIQDSDQSDSEIADFLMRNPHAKILVKIGDETVFVNKADQGWTTKSYFEEELESES